MMACTSDGIARTQVRLISIGVEDLRIAAARYDPGFAARARVGGVAPDARPESRHAVAAAELRR